MVANIFMSLLFLIGIQSQSSDKIFDEGVTWIYKAQTIKNSKIVRTDTLTLTVEKGNFMVTQQKISWGLTKMRADGAKIEVLEVTGVVENSERIWLHPPRFNGYAEFTEYSAFPEIRFPIKSGKNWETTLTLGDYETEESGPKVEVNYKIKSIDTLKRKQLNRRVKILGSGKSELGVYKNQMIFTDSLGFTKMTYEKENGAKLKLELIEKTARK